MKKKGKLTSDDYEMVDYMINQFKNVIGINGNAKRDKKHLTGGGEKQSQENQEQRNQDQPDMTKCVGYEF